MFVFNILLLRLSELKKNDIMRLNGFWYPFFFVKERKTINGHWKNLKVIIYTNIYFKVNSAAFELPQQKLTN